MQQILHYNTSMIQREMKKWIQIKHLKKHHHEKRREVSDFNFGSPCKMDIRRLDYLVLSFVPSDALESRNSTKIH